MANESGMQIVERDYARLPLTADEIEQIFGDDDLAAMLNTRHLTYKQRSFANKLPARAELISLIIAEPNLLRRPIARKGKDLVVGFDREALLALIAG